MCRFETRRPDTGATACPLAADFHRSRGCTFVLSVAKSRTILLPHRDLDHLWISINSSWGTRISMSSVDSAETKEERPNIKDRDEFDLKLAEKVSPEIKDLGKQFITLISSILAFTVAFADRIIDLTKSSMMQKLLLFGSWSSFVAAITAIGVGLWWNFNVPIYVAHGEARLAWREINFVYFLYLFAGFAFVLGLACLVLSVAARLTIVPGSEQFLIWASS